MNALVLAGSLAAVFVVAGVVKWLGLGRGAPLDAAAARQIATDSHVGHRFDAVVVAADGRAALVEGAEGEIVLVRALGDKWVTRLLAPPVALRVDGDALIIAAGETMFGPTTLTLEAAAAARWAAKLRGDADA